MSIPAIQKIRLGQYVTRNIFGGKQKFPLVLMLEPLFMCNLNCKGCGKTAHPPEILKKRLSVEECVGAAEECGAPVVSIPGGEPLMHPDIHIVVRELVKRKRFVYLCTNSLLVEKRIDEFSPSPYLTFNIHLDGLGEKHDEMVRAPGTFEKAVNAIRLLVSRGFRVTTNTTFFQGETPESAEKFLDFLTGLEVEAMTISAGFNYENASDRESFLNRETTVRLFRGILEKAKKKKWQFNHSILYLDFLAGNQNYRCTPWGNPTRNIFGWQRPCYLLDDEYVPSYRELIEETDWSKYGRGNDPRCTDCMVHCGYEPSAVIDTVKHPWKALKVTLLGIKTG
jgi:hopanoid biosynthesis associated radical SAM protein HpnH